jgi:hypothetical protein
MARYEGTQEIPPELWDAWKKTMGWAGSQPWAKKRMPFELPPMQSTGKRVRQSQLAQRARFIEAKNKFKTVPEAQRERWYDNAPIWNSFLWYYDYFIMSALAGNANTNQGGAGVIKSIQFVSKSIPTAGDESIAISAVDPDKSVVMLFGNSYISDKIQRGQNSVAKNATKEITLDDSINTDIAEVKLIGQAGFMDLVEGTGTGDWAAPVVDSLTTTKLTVKGPNVEIPDGFTFSWEVIEHKAQTIYPYVKSIAAESITIDWPLTPSVAAKIGAIVIEYI